MLYVSLIDPSNTEGRAKAKDQIQLSLDGLRRTGYVNIMPPCLLSRALVRHLDGSAEGANSDLESAWEISSRGQLRLYMADVQLHRARLFRDKKALVESRKFIEECGYWRRKEELKDAEEAAKNW